MLLYEGDDVVVDIVIGVEVEQFGDGIDCSFSDYGLIVGAELFEVGENEGVLVAEHGSALMNIYARLAYYSVMAKTT